jgi:subtilisin family serine protease
MFKWWKWLFFLLVSSAIFAQQQIELTQNDIISVPEELVSKIGSGELIKIVSEKLLLLKDGLTSDYPKETVQIVIYLEQYPSNDHINHLRSLGIICYEETWTPPLYDHPFGFIFAELPANRLIDVLTLDFIKKIDSSEQLSFPLNNEADRVLNADLVWAQGWTGNGITVGVLDSGLDTDPLNPDLPSTIVKKDYSGYPTLDDDVENQVTGHGTHVTGSVLGRGILSIDNIGNGGNPYKGVAPSADIVFLKIGNDYTGGASTNAIINALDAAVNAYNVDIISMSYGGWDTYHDGSSTKDQKVDWCYSQGVPVFLAAGNDGASGRHYSGTVTGNSTTDFIQINVTGAAANSTYLFFNLVWFDGLGTNNNLSITYYDDSFQQISNIYNYYQTESTKGTESKYSQTLFKVPEGNSIYYLKVENPSSNTQTFHIYESYNNGKVSFANADPNYTIVSPATATYGFCVGAFTSREVWTSYDSSTYSFNELLDEVASYSSRGPRVDEVQKPDVVAPGSAIISIRDRDVLTVPDLYWIDNDGNTTGEANYYVMQGTSMAAPLCAGAAALFLHKFPSAAPVDVYNALRDNTTVDQFTSTVPNSIYGYGKLNIFSAVNSSGPLPVELGSFSAVIKENSVFLSWRTETEVNNYGFDIEKKFGRRLPAGGNWEKIGFVEGYGNSNSPKLYSFIDGNVVARKYYYRLKQIDNDGSFTYSKVIEIDVGLPAKYELSQNFPNPFNPTTTIKYSLPKNEIVKLIVYNILGEEISILVNEVKAAGNYEVEFNGSGIASGVYIYRMTAGSFTNVKKFILLK